MRWKSFVTSPTEDYCNFSNTVAIVFYFESVLEMMSSCFVITQVCGGWRSEKLWARGAELHKRGGEGGKGRRTNSWHLRLLKYRPAPPLPVLLPDFAFNLLLSRESDAPSWTYSLSRFRVWGCSRQRSSCSSAPPPSWSPSPSRWRQPPRTLIRKTSGNLVRLKLRF